MPDLRGRSAREAAIAAARRGLVVELHGSGPVVAQSPEPGAEIEPGNTCVLTLGPGGGAAVRLSLLLAALPGAELHGDPELEIADVAHDSRRSAPGSLFVAIRGRVTDGNQFVAAARKKGAVAVCSEEPPSGEGAWVRVADAREALATLSAAILGFPARALELVGVTGTNGKTTTAYLVDSALRAAGETVGLLGTVEYRVGDRIAEAVRTTPESSDLQALFREMVDAGCRRAVLEVSSHSLDLKRVHGLEFRVAVFTNLTRDHLDFHGDMDAYFAAKRLLFERHLRADGQAIVNLDDDRAGEVVRASRGRVWTYSLEDPKADLLAEDVRLSLDGTRFRARTPAGVLEIETPLVGRFNVQNALAALGAGLALGLPPDAVQQGDRVPARRPRAHGARGRGPGLHRPRGLRPHGRRAQEPAGDRARPAAPPRHHRLRLRGRPRPHEAAAHGRGGGAALRRGHPDLRQPPQRAPGGDPRGDPAGDPGRAGRGHPGDPRPPRRHRPRPRDGPRGGRGGDRGQGARALPGAARPHRALRRPPGGARRPRPPRRGGGKR